MNQMLATHASVGLGSGPPAPGFPPGPWRRKPPMAGLRPHLLRGEQEQINEGLQQCGRRGCAELPPIVPCRLHTSKLESRASGWPPECWRCDAVGTTGSGTIKEMGRQKRSWEEPPMFAANGWLRIVLSLTKSEVGLLFFACGVVRT